MTDHLERSVREALADRAALMDTDAISRLSAVDYRPRRHRVPRPAAVGGLSSLGIAGAVAATLALTSASPAFAGWTPTPQRASSRELASVQTSCGKGLGDPVLTDSRGPYVAAIYDSSDKDAICVEGANVSLNTSEYYATAPTLPADQVQLGEMGQRDTQGDDLTVADGRVGDGVTGVTIQLTDGTTVQATVANGWYMAWWPGIADATTAQITSASGTRTQETRFPPAPTPACPDAPPTGGHCTTGFASSSGPGGASYSGSRSTNSAAGLSGNTGGDTGSTGNTGNGGQ